MEDKIIIGITGTIGAGKGTIVDYLVKNKNMVLVANDLREKYGSSYVAEELLKMAQESDKNCVLESLRTAGEIETLRKKGKFYLFAVDAERKTRYDRIQKRANAQSDNVSFEKFSEQEETEMKSDDPNKQNLSKCISMADYVIENNGTFEELYEKVDDILAKLS
jgi:dephospho-CoA kinase